jgi:hypothetical protein
MDEDTRYALESVAKNGSEKSAVRIAAINSLDPTYHSSRWVLQQVVRNSSEDADVRMAAINNLGTKA